MKKLLPMLVAILFAVGACSNDPGETEVATQQEDESGIEAIVEEELASEQEELVAEEAVAEVVAATSESEGDEAVDTSNEIVLALAEQPVTPPSQPSKYKEGEHYLRLSPTGPTSSSPEKIEVAEIFMFSCPHCYNFEPHLIEWRAGTSPDVEFVRIPAVFNQLAEMHAYAYYTAVELGIENEIMIPFFRDFHINRNPLNTEDQLVDFFAQFDISEKQFLDTYNSIEVFNQVKQARRLVRTYKISGVPALVINGKYTSGADMTGGYENLLEMVDELTISEATNR